MPRCFASRILSVAYGATCAVDAVSLELRPGRCLGVIGESGAGKTQAFLAMMGLLPHRLAVSGPRESRGRGRSAGRRRGERMRGQRVAMIFQDPMTSLTPHLRIGDQIAEPLVDPSRHELEATRARSGRAAGAGAHERCAAPAAPVPARVVRWHAAARDDRDGARLRAALLIADEPTTALDVTVQAQILALLRALVAERDMAVDVITHDMGVIAALADDVVVMHGDVSSNRARWRACWRAPEPTSTRAALLAATPRVDITRCSDLRPGLVDARGRSL